MLIEKVLSLNLPRYIAHVRKNNNVSLEVFRMRGFTPFRTLDRSIALIRESRGN
jgi:hypothetical protein